MSTNAEAPAAVLDEIARADTQGQKLLRDAAETMRLSARGYHRVLRVARTLADLDGAEKVGIWPKPCPTGRCRRMRGARDKRSGDAGIALRKPDGNEFSLPSDNHGAVCRAGLGA